MWVVIRIRVYTLEHHETQRYRAAFNQSILQMKNQLPVIDEFASCTFFEFPWGFCQRFFIIRFGMHAKVTNSWSNVTFYYMRKRFTSKNLLPKFVTHFGFWIAVPDTILLLLFFTFFTTFWQHLKIRCLGQGTTFNFNTWIRMAHKAQNQASNRFHFFFRYVCSVCLHRP